MGNRFDDSITVMAPGAIIAAAGTTARVAIPTCLSGEIPRYIRVAAAAAACVRLGTVTVNATIADTQVQPGDSTILAVPGGTTHIAAIQVTAPGQVQISPLENM